MRRNSCSLALVTASLLLLPKISAAQSPGTMVIDSATIALSGARTLADLLAVRVPGMSVSYLSGAPGIAAQVTSRSSIGFSGSGRPALIVDGVVLRDDQLWLTGQPDGQQLADHWNLPVEEIVKVEVVLGASDGMGLELGASRGAVLVTTHRPHGGAWNARTFADIRSVGAGPAIRPATTRTGDIGGGASTYYCTLQEEAAGGCTPTGTWTHSPFPGSSPFQQSQLIRGGISAAGGLPLGLQARVAVASTSEPGALGSAIARHDGALSLALPQLGRWSSSADVRLQQLDGDRLEYSLLRRYATYGPYDADSSLDQQVDVDDIRAVAPEWTSQRLSIGSRTQFALNSSTSFALQVGGERLSRSSFKSFHSANIPFGPGVLVEDLDSERNTWAASLSARNTRSLARAKLVTDFSFTRTHSVQDDSLDFRTIPDMGSPVGGYSGSDVAIRTSTQVLSLRWLDKTGVVVGAGLRREGFDSGKQVLLPFTDASWEWRPLSASAISRLQLRAAYGESIDVQSGLDAAMRDVTIFFGPTHGPVGPERTREAQLAAELHLVDGAVVLFGRAFDRNIRDAVIYGVSPSMFENHRLLAGGQIRARGGEVGVHLRRRLGATGNLTSSLWAAQAVSKYGEMAFEYESQVSVPTFGLMMPVRSGMRVGQVRNYRREFSDANLDGVIDDSELGDWVLAEYGSMAPTSTLGAMLNITLGRLSLGTTVDGKFGHVREGADDYLCSARRCDARYDPATSLRDQADAITASQSLVNADFVRMRELWVSWRADAGRLGEVEVSLVAQHLLTWAASDSDDPESGAPYGAGFASSQYQQPVAPTVGMRIKIGALSPR